MTTLRARAAANSASWQALKAWGDANLSTNLPDLYQGNDWLEYLLSYGLLFQVTGNQAYGNKGVVYLRALLNDKTGGVGGTSGQVGNGLGGDTEIQRDSGYVSRTIGAGVGVGRDWLVGASTLDQTTINLCSQRMAVWIPWIRSSWSYGQFWHNYGAGHFSMLSNAVLSLKDDPYYDPAWQSYLDADWMKVLAVLNEYDGSWGNLSYGDWSIRELLWYPLAVYSATGSTALLDSTTFPQEHIGAIIRFLHPNRGYTGDQGRFYQPKGYPTCMATLNMLAELHPSLTPTERGLARWYQRNITRTYGRPSKWQTFFWDDPTAATVAPTAANMRGVTGLAGGGEVTHLIARSAPWFDTAATYVDISGAIYNQDHANTEVPFDFGAMKIDTRGSYLMKGAGEQDAYFSTQNSLPLIAGTHTYAPRLELWGDGLQRFVTSFADGAYAYAKATGYEAYADRVHVDCTYGARSIVYLPPDLVLVYDNFTVPDANLNVVTERWWFAGLPTNAGQTASFASGAGKVVQTYITPAVSLAAPSNADGVDLTCYAVDGTPTARTTSNQIIIAFETMDAAGASAYTVREFGVTGAKAVYVENAGLGKSWIVVWTASITGANLTGTLTLDISSLSPRFIPTILVADLTPGTLFMKSGGPGVYMLRPGSGIAVNTAGLLVI